MYILYNILYTIYISIYLSIYLNVYIHIQNIPYVCIWMIAQEIYLYIYYQHLYMDDNPAAAEPAVGLAK